MPNARHWDDVPARLSTGAPQAEAHAARSPPKHWKRGVGRCNYAALGGLGISTTRRRTGSLRQQQGTQILWCCVKRKLSSGSVDLAGECSVQVCGLRGFGRVFYSYGYISGIRSCLGEPCCRMCSRRRRDCRRFLARAAGQSQPARRARPSDARSRNRCLA